jgi:hypothetical protein
MTKVGAFRALAQIQQLLLSGMDVRTLGGPDDPLTPAIVYSVVIRFFFYTKINMVFKDGYSH